MPSDTYEPYCQHMTDTYTCKSGIMLYIQDVCVVWPGSYDLYNTDFRRRSEDVGHLYSSPTFIAK